MPFFIPGAMGVRSNNLRTQDVTDLTPDIVAPGSTDLPLFSFTLRDSANEQFTQAVVECTGDSLSDLAAVLLYQESGGGVGSFNASQDLQLANATNITSWNSTLNFTLDLNRNTNYRFYVVVNLTAGAQDGNRVDARINIDNLTVQDRTWPDAAYDPAGNTTVDASPPGNWSGFLPPGWKNSRTLDCSVNVSDLRSGLNVWSAAYQFSNDSGANWSAWMPANCTGINGTVSNQTISAQGVPFGEDSNSSNLVRFRIRDMVDNLGTSPDYIVMIDTEAPGEWALLYPTDWYYADRRPVVRVAASDWTSGLDNLSASAEYSVDGGGNWSAAPSVNFSEPAGSLATENLTAWSVPFDQDSASLNLIRFNLSDLAGNWNASPVYLIRIDSDPPDAPVPDSLPEFTRGTSRNISWTAPPEPVSGLQKYVCVCDDDPGFSSPESVQEVNGTSMEFTDLTDGTRYYYEVASVGNSGLQGNFSLVVDSIQDASAPYTALATDPPVPDGLNGWFTRAVRVNLSAQDNTSGVARTFYSVNGTGNITGDNLTLSGDGEYRLSVWSEDAVGNVEEPRETLIRIDGTPPSAGMSIPSKAYVNESALLDGSPSRDALEYRWSFGDGSENATGRTVEHLFKSPGSFHIVLTVVDRAGLTCSTGADLLVQARDVNYHPVAVIGLAATIYVGEPATFDGGGSTDDKPGPLTYDWEFGDGNSGSGAVVGHTYGRDGDYTVRLRVTDAGGLSDTATRQVRVFVKGVNKPPLAQIHQVWTAYLDEPVLLEASNSTDENLPGVKFSWDFGDGSTAAGIYVSHVYAMVGKFLVTLIATDEQGLNDSAVLLLEVYQRNVNRPPGAQFTYEPFMPNVSQAVRFDASLTTDENNLTLNYSWDFGDGGGAQGRLANHTYLSAATYKVTLRVHDQGGLSDDYSMQVTVVSPQIPDKKPAEAGPAWWPMIAALVIVVAAAALTALALARRKKEKEEPPPAEEESHAPEGPQSLIGPTPVTHTESEIVIEEGLNYLIDRETPVTAYRTLARLASEGASALLITPVHPNKVTKNKDMENVEVLWLSEISGEHPSIDPAKMDYELAEKVITFIKEKESNAVVLMDGLELLIQMHGFEKVLTFIHGINEVASVNEATVLVNVNGKAMKEVEFNQLKRKFDRW